MWSILLFHNLQFLVEVKFGKVVQTTESNVSECKQQCVANEQCYRGECRCADGYKRGQNGTCMGKLYKNKSPIFEFFDLSLLKISVD